MLQLLLFFGWLLRFGLLKLLLIGLLWLLVNWCVVFNLGLQLDFLDDDPVYYISDLTLSVVLLIYIEVRPLDILNITWIILFLNLVISINSFIRAQLFGR